MENKRERSIRPKLNYPSQNRRIEETRTEVKEVIQNNIKEEGKDKTGLSELFKYKDEELVRKKDIQINHESIDMVKDIKTTIIPIEEWKQTFRKTDSVELVSLIQCSSVSHNALLRMTGSYSTKMLSNLKINSKEFSGIETRPTKVFFNKEVDIKQAIKTNMLSYIVYGFNYISSLEKGTTNRLYIDELLVLNEKLFFSLFIGNNEILDMECIVLTKANLINNDIETTGARDSLKVFITEEKNLEEVLGTIKHNLQQGFIFIVLNKKDKILSFQIYNKKELTPFSTDNLKTLFKDKIRYLKSDERHEEVKLKYNRTK